jgi:GNAT superfamily N-acetyltransferase
MLSIRALHIPEDSDGIIALDTSFETDRIYMVEMADSSVHLVETNARYRKQYKLQIDELARLAALHYSVVAVSESGIVGLAAAEYSEWNRRVILHHLYVSQALRQSGVGSLLLQNVTAWSASTSARCLWLETQNVNFPAIRFYKNRGFLFCGLDTSLYDPNTVDQLEIGLFFTKSLE